MKKSIRAALLTAAAAAFLMLGGCDSLKDVKETTVTVDEDGAVREIIVASMEEADYTAEELEHFVKEDIAEFAGGGQAESGVALDSFQVKEETVKIAIDYESAASYGAYHGTTFFAGTVAEAQAAGYDFNAAFQDNNKEAAASSTILSGNSSWKVLILEEPVRVQVSGQVLYASTQAEITGKKEVKITAGDEAGTEQAITTDSLVYIIYK